MSLLFGWSQSAWGYIAVVSTTLFWGTQSLPFKTKRVQDTNVNPFVYQLYFSFAIFVSSWLVLAIPGTTFVFTAWAFLSALLWVSTNVFWNYAIRFLGLGAAAGLGSGTTMAVSFIWGAAYFNAREGKTLNSIPGAIMALFTLFVGIGLVALAYTDKIQKLIHRFKCLSGFYLDTTSIHDESPHAQDHQTVELDHDHDDHHDIHNDHHHDDMTPLTPASRRRVAAASPASSSESPDISRQTKPKCQFFETGPTQDKIIGLILIFSAGIVNGSSLVPLKFAPAEAQGIQYMISFGIGVLIITPVLNLVYFGVIKREKPDLKISSWVVPTFASISGVMWNIGNFSSVFATLYLGFTIGFPLTQMNLVVQALFGIVLFREVRGKFELASYCFGVALILAGAFMLGSFA